MSEQGEPVLVEPFWQIDSISEGKVVFDVLERRFPRAYDTLSECLEVNDPMDIIYPEDSDEYSDVIAEILVLMARVNGDIRLLSLVELEDIVRLGFARRFGETPDEVKLLRAVAMLAEKAGIM